MKAPWSIIRFMWLTIEVCLVIILLVVIVWAIGELHIHGITANGVWYDRAARFATWINAHFGGAK